MSVITLFRDQLECILHWNSTESQAAAAQFIRKVAKRRCGPGDEVPVLEGRDNKDWIAMDLGNIALHIFSKRCRQLYDLETLWTVGAEYDDLANDAGGGIGSLQQLLQQHHIE